MPIHLDFKVDLGECLYAQKVMKEGTIKVPYRLSSYWIGAGKNFNQYKAEEMQTHLLFFKSTRDAVTTWLLCI